MYFVGRSIRYVGYAFGVILLGSVSAQPGALEYAVHLDGTGTTIPTHVIFDDSDNAFVVGNYSGTIDFDPGPGTAIHTSTVDAIGGGGSLDHTFVAKFDPSGNLLFVKTTEGYGTVRGGAIGLASNGDILVAARFETLTAAPGEDFDFDPGPGTFHVPSLNQRSMFLLRLDAAGDFVSVKTWSTSGVDEVDFYDAMVIDGADNIYLGGSYPEESLDVDPGPGTQILTATQQYGAFIIKLDASENLVYGHKIDGADGDFLDALAVDGSGNLYATGTFSNTVDFDPGAGTFNLSATLGTTEVFLLKLDPSGAFVSAISVVDDTTVVSGGGTDGRGLGLDTAGNIYVTGIFRGDGDFDPGAGVLTFSSDPTIRAMYAVKLDSALNLVYAKQFGGLEAVGAEGLFPTTEGTVYLVGDFQNTVDFDPGPGVFNLTAASRDGVVIRLNADGTFNYAFPLAGSANTTISSVAMDSGLKLHYTAYFNGTVDADPDSGSTVSLATSGTRSGALVKFGLEPSPPIAGRPYVVSITPYTLQFNQTVPVFSVVFNEPVTGVDATDFVISGTTGASVFGIEGSGTTWAVGLSMNPVQGEVVNLAFVDDDSVVATSDGVPAGGVGAGNGDFNSGVDININYPGITSDSGSVNYAFSIGDPATIDYAHDVLSDEFGNVYVVGGLEGTVDFDPGAGVTALTSTGDYDGYIAKYGPAGNLIFARSFGGAGQETALKVGRDRYDGSLYIYGHFEGTADFDPGAGTQLRTSVGQRDIYLLKLDQNGNWLETFTFGATYDDIAGDLLVDSRGYIFIGGTYTDSNFDADPGAGVYTFPPTETHGIFLIALDDDGVLRYAYHGATTNDVNIWSIAQDGQGSIYLAGTYTDPLDADPTAGTMILSAEMGEEGFIIRLAYNGVLADANTLRNGNPGVNAIIKIYDVAVDVYRNVYLCGSVVGTADFDPTGANQIYTTVSGKEAFLVKLDRNMNLVFDSHFPPTTGVSSGGEVASMVVDRDGGILLGGEFGGPTDFDPGAGVAALTSPAGPDGFLVRINQDGSFGFAHQLGATVEGRYRALHLEPRTGTLYTVGRLEGTGDFDISGTTLAVTSGGTKDSFVARYALSQPSYYHHLPLVDSIEPSASKAVGTVSFDVVFTHDVTGVDVTDFVLTGSGTGSITGVTGSGSTYQVFINYDDATGPLFLSLYDDDTIISVFTGEPLGGVGVDNASFLAGPVALEKDSTPGLPAASWWMLVLLAGLLGCAALASHRVNASARG